MSVSSVSRMGFAHSFFSSTRRTIAVASTASIVGLVLATSTFRVVSAAAPPITGTVFVDNNLNGVKDTSTGVVDQAISGVQIRLFDSAGLICGGATLTDAAGNFSVPSTCTGAKARLEASLNSNAIAHAGLKPGPLGGMNGTATGTANSSNVQFIDLAAPSPVSIGYANPSGYCGANPRLVISCFYNGKADNDIATNKALSVVPWTSSGESGGPLADKVADRKSVGSVWGVAYSRSRNVVYSAAVLKRHIGIGPEGLAAIYQTNLTTGATTLQRDLGGSVTLYPTLVRDLSTADSPSHDDATFDEVGKFGIGDIDINEKEDRLYFTSLGNATLGSFAIDNTAAVTSHGSPPMACDRGRLRLWGVKPIGSRVLVGAVCSGEAGGTSADVKGAVWSFDTVSTSWTNVVDIPNYASPEGFGTVRATFGPWGATWDKQMIVSDIEVDGDGSLSIAIMDRRGLQHAANNYEFKSTTLSPGIATAGDVLKACFTGTNYQLEAGGKCGANTGVANNEGPGGGEFYSGDAFEQHLETGLGSLAQISGGEIATSVFDPSAVWTSGVRWMSQSTGIANRSYQVQGAKSIPAGPKDEKGSLGKAMGIGDIEMLCNLAPIEIGNRVWHDVNDNGVQDPAEPGLAGVQVKLSGPDGKSISVLTDVSGAYLFSSRTQFSTSKSSAYSLDWLKPNTSGYELLIVSGQANTNGMKVSPRDAVSSPEGLGSDARDSDGAVVGTNGQSLAFGTGEAGLNDHRYDFGFSGTLVAVTTTVAPTTVAPTAPPTSFPPVAVTPPGTAAPAVVTTAPTTTLTTTVATATTLPSTVITTTPPTTAPAICQIKGSTFIDANANGTADLGEFGMGSAVVTATGPDGNQTKVRTDSQGMFVFTGLPNGTYKITVTSDDPSQKISANVGTLTITNGCGTSSPIAITVLGAELSLTG
jgi:SdrD B-like domain